MNINIRCETPEEYDSITFISDKAFDQKKKGNLIIDLRKRPEFMTAFSMISGIDCKPAGHIFFSPVSIISGDHVFETLTIAQLNVPPEFRNKELGGTPDTTGLNKVQSLISESAGVPGQHACFLKSGFSKESRCKINAPFDFPDEVFRTIELEDGILSFGKGLINYPKKNYDVQ